MSDVFVLSSKYEGLSFEDRFLKVWQELGYQPKGFDFSLPFKGVTEDTPFWTGPAVFNALTNTALLDVVEELIGPEIYSNPVQHVRIKPPEKYLPKNEEGLPQLGATQWHQDHGVVTEEADKTEADEDVEVEEVTICDELYYTDNAEAGTIYACLQDGTVGDEVGHFEDGHAFFS